MNNRHVHTIHCNVIEILLILKYDLNLERGMIRADSVHSSEGNASERKPDNRGNDSVLKDTHIRFHASVSGRVEVERGVPSGDCDRPDCEHNNSSHSTHTALLQ